MPSNSTDLDGERAGVPLCGRRLHLATGREAARAVRPTLHWKRGLNRLLDEQGLQIAADELVESGGIQISRLFFVSRIGQVWASVNSTTSSPLVVLMS